MPVLLTTPIATGDLDPAGPYTHARIDWFAMLVAANKMELVLSYGTMPAQDYIQGPAKPVKKYVISGNDFLNLVQTYPDVGVTIYDAAAKELYQWLIDKGHISGTIL